MLVLSIPTSRDLRPVRPSFLLRPIWKNVTFYNIIIRVPKELVMIYLNCLKTSVWITVFCDILKWSKKVAYLLISTKVIKMYNALLFIQPLTGRQDKSSAGNWQPSCPGDGASLCQKILSPMSTSDKSSNITHKLEGKP